MRHGNQAAVVAVSDPLGTCMAYDIIREVPGSTTTDVLAVGKTVAPGRTRWVTLTNANTNAQKDTAILAALRA